MFHDFIHDEFNFQTTIVDSYDFTPSPGAFLLHFSVTCGADQSQGQPFLVTVAALDQFNNSSTQYLGVMRFGSSDPLAVLPAPGTLTAGQGIFSATLLTTGAQTLTATDIFNPNVTGNSGPVVVEKDYLVLQLNPHGAQQSGVGFLVTVTAIVWPTAVDTGYLGTVHFITGDTGATLPPAGTLISGVGKFSVTLAAAGAQYQLRATDTVHAGITGAIVPVVITTGGATHFNLNIATTVTHGVLISFTVTALTSANATATSYTGTVVFSGNGTESGLVEGTLVSGVGVFTVTFNTPPADTLTVSDTVASTITGTSGVIIVV